MKKRYFLILPLLTLLASCTYSGRLIINGTKKITNKEISASYTKMEGTIGKTFKVKKDYEYNFILSVITFKDSEGGLYLKTFYNGEEKESRKISSDYFSKEEEESKENNYNFSITDEGKWDIRIIGENHKGSFTLTWEKVALSN